MSKNILDNTLWVIRSAGERTTDICEHLVRQFAPAERVQVIYERPFNAAVRRGFELGRASGLKWTCCIDADVLLLEQEITEQLRRAETLAENVFCVQGLVYGKFLPIRRPAGNHLYRNALAAQALPLIPPDGDALRPESVTTQAMKDRGYFTYQTDVVVGLHDYEQYYQDIYRKCFLHINKHEADLMPMVESHWRQHRITDQDYEVALLGALAGKVHEGKVYIDRQFQAEEAQKMLTLAKIEEKPPLVIADYSPEKLRSVVRDFRAVDAIQAYKNPRYQENYVRDVVEPVNVSLPKKAVKKILYTLSKLLTRVGKGLTQAAQ